MAGLGAEGPGGRRPSDGLEGDMGPVEFGDVGKTPPQNDPGKLRRNWALETEREVLRASPPGFSPAGT